jgi:transcription elongation factor Elf1
MDEFSCENCAGEEFLAKVDENARLTRLVCMSCDTRYAVTEDRKLVELQEREQ